MTPHQQADGSASAPDGLLTEAFAQFPAPAMLTDSEGNILWANRALCELSGYAVEELLGHTPSVLRSGRHDAAFYRQLWDTVRAGRIWRGDVIDRRKDGTLYVVEEAVAPLRDAQGAIRHFVAVQHDITQREARREHEHYLAYHDVLTRLPNRAMLDDIAQKAALSALRSEQPLAMMFLDLDGFKAINDTLGHHVGDQLLAAVAQRLQSGIRRSDTVARIGGDEFAVLLADLDSRASAGLLAQKLLDALARPFQFRKHRFTIRASVGIAIFPSDATSIDALLNQADQAMYLAKLQGGQRYHFFDQGDAQRRKKPAAPRQETHGPDKPGQAHKPEAASRR
ncbi:diguanylate cyclase [Massilia atriviolacea]|uniref:Sensor domain-containing diguanylate cyclase n=1 Tax=Massilia atriviolacea TaxID=2495579 RepID=A0A430HUG0_9BURK|nr:sensor domain-containing diguanylate cyclase [Massilia atriviolacea]RSZ61112.1 sensor domain-containing diguanylate cyclase [Massilia atriviolacea]